MTLIFDWYHQEIVNQYPKKKVTIVQSSDRLLNDQYPTKLSDRLKRELEARGVKIILGERVEKDVYEAGKGTVTLKDGTSIDGQSFPPSLAKPSARSCAHSRSLSFSQPA